MSFDAIYSILKFKKAEKKIEKIRSNTVFWCIKLDLVGIFTKFFQLWKAYFLSLSCPISSVSLVAAKEWDLSLVTQPPCPLSILKSGLVPLSILRSGLVPLSNLPVWGPNVTHLLHIECNHRLFMTDYYI